MQLRASRNARHDAGNGAVRGTVRLDRRTKDLVRRLHPGNIAVVDHEDIDLLAAENLIEHGVAAVVNARRSISGRYPNLGPLILARAGVRLVDGVGDDVFAHLDDGDIVELHGGTLLANGRVVAEGDVLTERAVRERMRAAREALSATVEEFAENTLDYVRKEQHLLLDSVRLPDLRTSFQNRYALVVVRGYHYREDLAALRGFIREMRPVVVAVDGAADACLQQGVRPDVIVGDVDSVSVDALRCGAEIVVHPQGDWRRTAEGGGDPGESPEAATVRALGLDCKIVTAPGMSEDVALLLAHEKGADLVVAVGCHGSAIEMLDKGRRGMASTFLVRMRLGPDLVDAKGVSRLYRTRVATRDLGLLVASALTCVLVVSATFPPMRLFWLGLWDQFVQRLGALL